MNLGLWLAVQRAKKFWAQGHTKRALETIARAHRQYGPTADSEFVYGVMAIEEEKLAEALEAFHDAVKLDVTHLDALELFLEVNRSSVPIKGAATRVLSRLAELLPRGTEFDVQAATLLLPSMHMVEVIDQKVRMLRYSEDPIAKQIATLAAIPSEDWGSVSGNNSHALIARLIVSLSRNDTTQVSALIGGISPRALPKRAMRMAIRQKMRNYEPLEARMLLEYYRRADPKDRWAEDQLQKVAKSKAYLSKQQLTTQGFPFPEAAIESEYAPNRRKVFYLLHSSLPYHSVGYATRTHGLLQGIRGHAWDVQGVTRLGYPFDMPQMEALSPIAPSDIIDGVPYQRLSVSPGTESKQPLQAYVSRYVAELKKLARAQRPFVMHAASNHWNGLAGVSAARELGIPSIYEVRGLWEITRGSRNPEWAHGETYQHMARMEADAAVNADQVITITNALRDELVNRGVDENKITVIPNGVDVSRFKPREKNTELAARLGLQNKTVIGYVGTILNYEGIALLLDVAGKLKQERNDVAFLFVGDGAELEEYRERVQNEELSDNVIFTGRVPHNEAEEYYSIINICPFPRLPLPVCEMVSPLKPFEAMAMGKAIVASNVAALSEIVTNGVNGLLFEKGNADDLARVIGLLLDNPNLTARLAEAGRRWVSRERDWNILSEQVSTIYASLSDVQD